MRKITILTNNLELKERISLKLPFILSVIANITLIGVIVSFKKDIVLKREKIIIEKMVEDMPLTDSAIISELTSMGCMLPNVALAQFKVETGHFLSKICKENKNIAGIRTSKSEFVKGLNRGHCVYNTYRDCLRDYVRIQNRYLKNINNKYAESKTYISVLKSIK